MEWHGMETYNNRDRDLKGRKLASQHDRGAVRGQIEENRDVGGGLELQHERVRAVGEVDVVVDVEIGRVRHSSGGRDGRVGSRREGNLERHGVVGVGAVEAGNSVLPHGGVLRHGNIDDAASEHGLLVPSRLDQRCCSSKRETWCNVPSRASRKSTG